MPKMPKPPLDRAIAMVRKYRRQSDDGCCRAWLETVLQGLLEIKLEAACRAEAAQHEQPEPEVEAGPEKPCRGCASGLLGLVDGSTGEHYHHTTGLMVCTKGDGR